MNIKVSIIIPTTNKELKLAERCASYCRESTYKNIEIIVVNENKERSEQRNIGIGKSTGDCLFFLDSDQYPSPNLISECVVRIRNGYTSVYIPEIIVAKSFFGKVRRFEREFLTGTHVDVPRFVIKKYCPLFNEEISGPEDALFGSQIPGLRTISKSVLYHNDDISFFEYVRKKIYYTKSMKRYAELNPTDPCLNLWYRCVVVYTEKSKWKKLVRHPILTICLIFLIGVRGVIYATKG